MTADVSGTVKAVLAEDRCTLENDLVIAGDNAPVLSSLPAGMFDLAYVDPPFNTGRIQRRRTLVVRQSEDGDRRGFQGRTYATEETARRAYVDDFDDYVGFLAPRLEHARRLLTLDGTLYFHIDCRESHYCKVLLDEIFGRECFLNEIIWAYDFGGRGRRRWPAKHDSILFYVKDPARYIFNAGDIDRLPYMTPGLVGPEKAARGKLPTDVWWHTIVPTSGRERTGYPTQKPLAILKRIVAASSRPGDTVLDFFAGSGTTGEAAHLLGRAFVLVDNNPQALEVMAARFRGLAGVDWVGFVPPRARAHPARAVRRTAAR